MDQIYQYYKWDFVLMGYTKLSNPNFPYLDFEQDFEKEFGPFDTDESVRPKIKNVNEIIRKAGMRGRWWADLLFMFLRVDYYNLIFCWMKFIIKSKYFTIWKFIRRQKYVLNFAERTQDLSQGDSNISA